jgi:hypothetical protein
VKAVRLTTYDRREILPHPNIFEQVVSTGENTFRFLIDIPSNLPPHQYFLKLLAASDEDLAFATRIVFVD